MVTAVQRLNGASDNKPYSQELQLSIARLFTDVVEEQDRAMAILLRKLIEFSNLPDSAIASQKIQKLIDNVPQDQLLELTRLHSTMLDMEWRARKAAGINVINSLAEENKHPSGDRFEEVIGRFKSRGLTAEQVQEQVDQMLVWPSLTAHPTNPTVLAYTQAALQIDRLLADPALSKEQIKEGLRVVRDTPMNGEKKTPEQEGEELLLFLDNIYDSISGPHRHLRQALDKHGYGDVEIRHPLLDINLWGVGDGDGNSKMTAEELEKFFGRLRERIVQRYSDDIGAIASQLRQDGETALTESYADFGRRVVAGEFRRNSEGLMREMDRLASATPAGTAAFTQAEDLAARMETFGSRFARVDIRHNAKDVMAALGRILESTHIVHDAADFQKMSEENQKTLIKGLFSDKEFIQRVKTLDPDAMVDKSNGEDKDGETAKRILGRLRVVAENPEMSQKFIMAETNSANQGLAALLLLKVAGNEVANEKASIDVVPLFETRRDLVKAKQIVHELMSDDVFGQHVLHRGRMIAMVARSDTSRLAGAAAQGQQEECYGEVLTMNGDAYAAEIAKMHQELQEAAGSGIKMCIMQGGGDDQMRGGGRIVEAPHVVLRAAARAGGEEGASIAMTIQGLQNQLVFGSRLTSEHFIEAFAAQHLLANSRIEGLLEWRKVPEHINEVAAHRQSREFFNNAMDNYEAGVGQKGSPIRETLVDYLNNYPSEIMQDTSKGCRPLARASTNDPLEGRAISLDQRSKHDGAYPTATLGVRDALRALADAPLFGEAKPGEDNSALRHTYEGNKSFRDFVCMQAVVLHQKDYEMAWRTRGGRPDPEEWERLAASYKPDQYNEPKVFLAHLEKADLEEAKYLVEAITGKKQDKEVDLKEPLRAGWPELALQMEFREHQALFSKLMETHCVNKINECHANHNEVPQELRDIAYYSYVGSNTTYSSPSFTLRQTDPNKEQAEGRATETSVSEKLTLPPWAQPALSVVD